MVTEDLVAISHLFYFRQVIFLDLEANGGQALCRPHGPSVKDLLFHKLCYY